MRIYWLGLILLLGWQSGCAHKSSQNDTESFPSLNVAAASDLTPAFLEMGQLLEVQKKLKIIFSFGSSGLLAKQIEQGAPFDLFASASLLYVDRLKGQSLTAAGSEQIFAQGRLVIWQRQDAALRIDTLEQMALPAVHRIAIANPEHAPYGLAAKEALQRKGLWDTVLPKAVFGENIAQTLQFAQTGNVDAAIVALSLVSGSSGRVIAIDPDNHSPINQVICILSRTHKAKAAREFVSFLRTPEGQAILKRYGFVVPGEHSEAAK